MSYESILATLGLSQLSLEVILIFASIAVVVGYGIVMCWQYILAGIFVLAVLFVFAHHPKDANAEPVKTEVVKASEPVKEKTDEEMFMEDCVELSSKPATCKDLWKERNEE
jgi:uncharacterized membrane protein YhiD involved in acid resistance